MRYVSKMTRKSLIISIIIGTIGGLTAIGMFSLSGLMLSKSAYQVPLYSLMILVATIKLFGVIRAICKYFERLISHEATFEMLKDVRVTTVRSLLDNFIAIQSKYHLSTLLNRTVNDVEKLQNLLLRVIYPPVIALVTAIIVVCIYAQFSLYAVVVLLIAMLILTFVLPVITTRYLTRVVRDKEQTTKLYEQHLLDYQLSKEALMVFDTNNTYLQQLRIKEARMEQALRKENAVIIIYDFLLNSIAMLAIFLVIFLMMHDPTLNTMMYLSMVMVAITLFEMSVPMVHYPYHKVETGKSIQHLDELNVPVQIPVIDEEMQSIRLENVSVDTRLNNINMHIEKGQFIGVAGQSGAGKTTLINTILGLNKITGRYILNGREIDVPANLLEMFNVMEQHNHFINGTVADNMFAQVDTARLNALLQHFNLPFTSESEIQPFGENLSGGEKQRLHFIRMILRNQPLWILDEPFNGVDTANQHIMLSYLKQLQDVTIIMVTHDLSVCETCDTLILLDDGKVIETGDAKVLHQEGTRFNKLSQKQLLSI